ncbi:MAG: hypothetical protein K2J47_00375 [Ruminococcus sp.]|nr:hypothetical protein [Ruminococcus sp.]
MSPKIRKIIILTVMTALIIVIALIRINYIFIDGKLYRNDTVVISRVYANKKSSISELNRCNKLEELSIWDVNDNVMSEIKTFEKLSDLTMFDVDLGVLGTSKLNALNRLEHILFVRAILDLTTIDNDSLKILSISLGDVTGINGCINCSSLKELNLKEVTIKESIICTDNKKYILKNSSDFAALDNIKLLKIYDTEIEDISGILDMESLEELTVSDGMISEDDHRTLEEKGIIVTEKSSEN